MIMVSIIIPTFNRPARLATCLDALARLRFPKQQFEVVVVDDGGSTELEPLIAPLRDSLSIRLVKQENTGPAGARNQGAAHAAGVFLAFTDDDCAPDEDWLAALVRRLEQHPSRMYGGCTVNVLEDNAFSSASQSLIDYLYGYYNADPERARFFTSNNIAMSRVDFDTAGGFSRFFPQAAGEDRELCDRWLQLGRTMNLVPEAKVRHGHELNFRSFWKQHFNYGIGARRLRECKRRRGHGEIKLEPPTFYLQLVAHPWKSNARNPLALSLLMVLSQVANAAGFAWANCGKAAHSE